MKGTPERSQQWTVHAEFSISHPGIGDPKNPPKTGTIHDENGVRMLYSWSENSGAPPWQGTQVPSGAMSPRLPFDEANRHYGFQRGNLFFTSTPPRRYPGGTLGIPDSGYGSDFLSQNSCATSLPRRCIDPFNRKCSSTCNIILSNNNNDQNLPRGSQQCGRTQSLRCQTPSASSDVKSDTFYGCGDPWCHHLHQSDDFSTPRRISPVRELCEEPRPNCTCAVCDPECKNFYQALKKDVSVQTLEMVNKCTSPLMQLGDLTKPSGRSGARLKRGKTIDPSQGRPQGSRRPSQKAESTDTSQHSLPRLSRSPTLKDLPSIPRDKSLSSEDKLSDSTKKPRTIHIDVYCTGTDLEADSSTSSSDSEQSKSASTPQTVFESDKLHVTHEKADNRIVPHNLRTTLAQTSQKSNTTSTSLDKDESDDESTAYPSKLSSYSNIGYSLSSTSSFPNSVTPYSVSSCTVPDLDVDSLASTSWKDTFSDIDSLLHSRSTIGHNDSSYFVAKRIDEENESLNGSSKNETQTTNSLNLQASDSFEYANSEDRLRIRRMEKFWKNRPQWKQVQSKRKLFSQQKQLQDAVNKRLSKMDVSKDSDSDGSDECEQGWTFVKNEKTEVDKEITSSTGRKVNRRNYLSKVEEKVEPVTVVLANVNKCETASQVESFTGLNCSNKHSNLPEPKIDVPVNSNLNNSALETSPSLAILKQRLINDPTLGSPFTIFPGQYTQPRMIAKRFGPVVNTFRKPGHHIGPVRNPDCLCDHCRRHYESLAYRNRTSSVGGTSRYPAQNWHEIMNPVRRSTSEQKSFEQVHGNL